MAVLIGAILLSRRVRRSQTWRATVTPLASIIGSGFLVVVPLLGTSFGEYALPAIAGVVLFAYWVGYVIRFNIKHSEPLLEHNLASHTLADVERLSDLALGAAFFISVTFYLRLLASFALRGIGVEDEFVARILTTGFIGFIALFGYLRGMSALEALEEYSVSVKIAVVVALITGLAVYDGSLAFAFDWPAIPTYSVSGFEALRIIAGILIIVQGFETSRYLEEEYDQAMRVRTMRFAQMISGVVYVVFVGLALSLLTDLPDEINETAIIDLSKIVNPILPAMLILAAIMSQFSAAVADTIGAGGLVSESFGHRIGVTSKVAYAMVGVVAIILNWTTNIFTIISIASRAFAFYYALQAVVAFMVTRHLPHQRFRLLRGVLFVLTALVLVVVVVIALPAG